MAEVWKVKDAIAAEHGYDVRRLAAHLQKQESASSAEVIDLRSGKKREKTG